MGPFGVGVVDFGGPRRRPPRPGHGSCSLVECFSDSVTILDDVGLDVRFRGKLIGAYSTGMKRRVEIARALMGRPKVLFLDEPTRGLDLPAKRDMWNLLRRLAREDQVTTFLSSHDAQEVRSLCSEISVIAQGKLVHSGPTLEIGHDLDTFEERLIELLTGSTAIP